MLLPPPPPSPPHQITLKAYQHCVTSNAWSPHMLLLLFYYSTFFQLGTRLKHNQNCKIHNDLCKQPCLLPSYIFGASTRFRYLTGLFFAVLLLFVASSMTVSETEKAKWSERKKGTKRKANKKNWANEKNPKRMSMKPNIDVLTGKNPNRHETSKWT